ncbi:transcriptional regulator [Candidatus Roizmanbacteria bacterium CG22_combo_CG10-13_8_21_14_all_38_20]|uniref:Transcriptional regulator n=1 Tax=Candidatus Roizmanbacteria bacterium CG22_combo_CG10-13_8_21_14_all_38_20 TaxID=1974862 RepID=A0A2H0BU33_9BACT|nr:transcriptional regulator [Candidatus Microgenomates bacterium]PIP61197.1 MAG: transcriptional regulator [Candidatus Roizmanbacteria bacterium CG22_combo_CG10-13_8_21_14_all_38_20]PJC31187.1 MAG: transcriptional regulator [Candidatus Roizmanbacteria bacterium CG_4_9_14_0_2_um_filter_38_17]
MDKRLKYLINSLLAIKTDKAMYDFLLGILTPRELQELPSRLEIVKLLKQGVPQHRIAETLGTGVATVTRGSKEIQKGRFKNIT